MTFDMTEIFKALIELVFLCITVILVPFLKQRYGDNKVTEALKWVKIAFAAAEQIYTAADGDKKKKWVLDYLEQRGIILDEDELDAAIEAAVLELHSKLYGAEKAA